MTYYSHTLNTTLVLYEKDEAKRLIKIFLLEKRYELKDVSDFYKFIKKDHVTEIDTNNPIFLMLRIPLKQIFLRLVYINEHLRNTLKLEEIVKHHEL